LSFSAKFIPTAGNVFLFRHGIELLQSGGTNPSPLKLNTDYTISGWVYMVSADDLDLRASYADDVANFTNAQDVVTGGTVIASVAAGVWKKFRYTFNSGAVVPVASNKSFALSFNNNIPDNQSYLAGMKLEEGDTATLFTRAGNTLAGELAMCQRYYSVKWGVGHFTFNQSNDYRYGYSHPVQMRTTPAVSVVTGVTANWNASYPGRTSNNFYSSSSSQLTSVTADVPSVQSDAEL